MSRGSARISVQQHYHFTEVKLQKLYSTLMIHGENRSKLFRKIWLDAADQRFHNCTHVAGSTTLECRRISTKQLKQLKAVCSVHVDRRLTLDLAPFSLSKPDKVVDRNRNATEANE